MTLRFLGSGRWVRTAALALGLGLALAVAVFGTVLWVSNDMRLMLAIGMVGIFFGSLWLAAGSRAGSVWIPLLVVLPLNAVFVALVLPQLPGLWPHVVVWLLVGALGWFGGRAAAGSKWVPWLAAVGLVLAAGWYAQAYVPDEISRSLTHLKNEPAPEFSLTELDGSRFPVESLDGKVVVLDFFATWCAPCVAELPELEALRERLRDREDVEILVVANDSGGDTPESIQSFKESRGIDLPFVYDPQGTAHRAFGFLGLPGLVVIDRSGNVRLTREGFNEAERDVPAYLAGVIDSLP